MAFKRYYHVDNIIVFFNRRKIIFSTIDVYPDSPVENITLNTLDVGLILLTFSCLLLISYYFIIRAMGGGFHKTGCRIPRDFVSRYYIPWIFSHGHQNDALKTKNEM